MSIVLHHLSPPFSTSSHVLHTPQIHGIIFFNCICYIMYTGQCNLLRSFSIARIVFRGWHFEVDLPIMWHTPGEDWFSHSQKLLITCSSSFKGKALKYGGIITIVFLVWRGDINMNAAKLIKQDVLLLTLCVFLPIKEQPMWTLSGGEATDFRWGTHVALFLFLSIKSIHIA